MISHNIGETRRALWDRKQSHIMLKGYVKESFNSKPFQISYDCPLQNLHIRLSLNLKPNQPNWSLNFLWKWFQPSQTAIIYSSIRVNWILKFMRHKMCLTWCSLPRQATDEHFAEKETITRVQLRDDVCKYDRAMESLVHICSSSIWRGMVWHNGLSHASKDHTRGVKFPKNFPEWQQEQPSCSKPCDSSAESASWMRHNLIH